MSLIDLSHPSLHVSDPVRPTRRRRALLASLALLALGAAGWGATSEAVIPETGIEKYVGVNGASFRLKNGAGDPVLLRGVNLGNWLTNPQPNLTSDWVCLTDWPTNGDYRLPIYTTLTNRFGDAGREDILATAYASFINVNDLDNLARMGMNFIRVPVSYLNFMEPEAPTVPLNQVRWKSDAIAYGPLDWVIREAGQRGIYVLLDYHHFQGTNTDPSELVPGTQTLKNPDSFFNLNNQYQARAIEVIRRLAARYRGNPRVIGIDPLNEPWSTARTFYNQVHTVVRNEDPDRLLFLETWSWAGFPELGTGTGQFNWSKVVFSPHFYPTGDNAALQASITSLLSEAQTYQTNPALRKQVPMHIGEFYLNTPATMDTWRMMIRGFNQAGHAWTKWSYKSNTDSGWSTYALGFDPLAKDNRPNPDINYSTQDLPTIKAKWAQWATPAHPVGQVDHLDSSNRQYAASPVAHDDAFTAPPQGTFLIPTATVMANDVSANPDAALTLVPLPTVTAQGGTMTPVSDGYVYQPKAGFTGTDTVAYRVQDTTLTLPSAWPGTVRITVPQAVSTTAPYGRPDAYDALRDRPLAVGGAGVLANDGDILNRSLKATVVSGPTKGTLHFNSDGSFVYLPPPASDPYSGVVSFTYQPVAGTTSGAPITVTIRLSYPAPTNGTGLKGTYWDGWGWPLYETVIDPQIDFFYGTGVPVRPGMTRSTWHSLRWDGYVFVPMTDTYTFTRTSIDGCHGSVSVAKTLVVPDTENTDSGTIALTGGGLVEVAIPYVRGGNRFQATLTWANPLARGGGAQVVPQAYFFPSNQTPTFAPPVPTPWIDADVGSPALPGQAALVGERWTVTGGGGDIWGTSDQFHFTHQPLAGDGALQARVEAPTGTDPWAKAGLMIRTSTAAGSANAFLGTSTANGVTFQVRTASGASTTSTKLSRSGPTWVRLVRLQGTITAYQAPDVAGAPGVWSLLGAPVTLAGPALAGLAVTAHNNSRLSGAVFTAVSLATQVTSPWTTEDVGAPTVAGTALQNGADFTLLGAGTDIWGTADQFRFVSQELIGDGSIEARIDQLQNTDPWAKAGVMLRQGTGASAPFLLTAVTPLNGVATQWRTTTGGGCSHTGRAGTSPCWVRVERVGSQVQGWTAPDVQGRPGTWSTLGAPQTLTGTLRIGLAVTSHLPSTRTTALVSQVLVQRYQVPPGNG